MSRPSRTTLALLALVTVMLVGCHEPAGMPNDAHTATTATLYVTTQNIMRPCGHIEWWQWENLSGGDYYYNGDDSTIRRAFEYYAGDTIRAYPRKNGHCVFKIPGFNWTGDLPACTLFYYQSAHNGLADLAVTAWHPGTYGSWPPYFSWDRESYFISEWISSDTIATDSTHANNGNWYKVELSYWATCAIADSGSKYYGIGGGACAFFYTGWLYPSYSISRGQDGWFTDVSGSSGYAPYIKVVYEPGP